MIGTLSNEDLRKLLSRITAEVLQASQKQELDRFADAYPAVSEQANSFLTQIVTLMGIYTSVTGAAWVVTSSNTLGLSYSGLLGIFALHVVLSGFTAFCLWGISNNFIQRLNFARWLGREHWPTIEEAGGPSKAWAGIPNKDGQLLSPEDWERGRKQPKLCEIALSKLIPVRYRYGWRYKTRDFPTLRFVRFVVFVPFFVGLFSIYLMKELMDGKEHREVLCEAAGKELHPEKLEPKREVIDRARYVFDKAGCELEKITKG